MIGNDRFDAVVIGGGPAGAAAALQLSRAGWRTALVEKGPRHRTKTCGHCLSPRAMPLLQHLGIAAVSVEASAGRTRMLRVHLPGGRSFEVPFTFPGRVASGIIVDRSQFDQLIVDRAASAGVECFQPASMIRCNVHEGQAEIEVRIADSRRTLRCGLLVGADGLRSRVAAAAGLSGSHRSGRNFGFSFDVCSSRAAMIESGAVEMFVVPGGYLGIVNQGAGRLHLAGLVRPNGNESRDPRTFCMATIRRFPMLTQLGMERELADLNATFQAAGPMPCSPRRRAARGVALVGDAAGYVDPFTGEGMTWALHSALLLGDIAADAQPGCWTMREVRAYDRAWRRSIGRSHLLCRGISTVLRRRNVLTMAAAWGAARPSLLRRVAELVVSP